MSNRGFEENLIKAMEELDEKGVLSLVKEGLQSGIKPFALTEALSQGLQIIGKRFEAGEAFIPELMKSGCIFGKAVELIEPHLDPGEKKVSRGKVLMGTVFGDLHDLGKNLVGLNLSMAGYEVVDIGKNVPAEEFVRRVREEKPDVLGLSALLTTTMFKQRDVINALREAGLRDQVKIIVGGAPVTQEWADEIGADSYGADAIDSLDKVNALMGC